MAGWETGWRLAGSVGLLWAVSGCSTPAQNSGVAVAGVTALGHLPSHQIVQTYYLGVFDPQDQLPPTIYRLRVQGQAGAISPTAFASGWLPAGIVDSLSSQVTIDGRKGVSINDGAAPPAGAASGAVPAQRLDDQSSKLSGRRLMLFGPEGFREAPRDHRLVIVMGSRPETFFNSIDQALGAVASATQGNGDSPGGEKALWEELVRIRRELVRTQTVNDLLPAK